VATSPVTLDFSKAQPLPQPVTLDFSKAQPIAATPPSDSRSLLQSSLDASGLSTIGSALRHPLDTLGNVADAAKRVVTPGQPSKMSDNPNPIISGVGKVWDNTVDNLHKAAADYKAQSGVIPTLQVRRDLVNAVPIAGPALQTAQGQYDAGNTAGAIGTVLGTAAGLAGPAILHDAVPAIMDAAPKVAGKVLTATKLAGRVPEAVSQGVDAFKQATYPKNMSLSPEQATAQSVVKALQPDAAAIPNVKSASPELPDALAYAQKNNIPQNGKIDTANALRGRAAEIQAHYDDAILKPNNTAVQTIPDNYNGQTVGNNKATLGQIDDRVNDINSELKSNFRKKLASQTTEANASDADLIAEKGALTDILHTKLGELTGIDPADIADIRQRAGKLRSLAQEVTDSADKDTISAGKREVSGPGFATSNPITSLQDAAGGGQEIIGNRVWKQALDGIKPAEKPLPQPVPPGPNVATTPEAAQAEFLRSQQLEQSAQDAAAGRDQRVAGYRAAQSATKQAGTELEGEAARTIGRGRVMSAWAAKGAASLASSDASLTPDILDAVGKTPAGQQLLVNASSLTPRSAMMKTIAQQIKALTGAK